jgi:hypothetical protein
MWDQFMIIFSHVKIIAFQLSLFCKNYRFLKTDLYIINRKIHGCLEIPDLFLVLNMISHSFAALTLEISCSTLENKSGISAHPCIILYIAKWGNGERFTLSKIVGPNFYSISRDHSQPIKWPEFNEVLYNVYWEGGNILPLNHVGSRKP